MRQRLLTGNEDEAQEMLFERIQYQLGRYPELKLLYHIPNGGKRDKGTAVKLYRQGVKAGVPDLHLPVARGGYHGLYIELKVGKNKTTEKQKEWIAELNKQGYLAIVCYGWEEAAEQLINYLGLGTLKEAAETAAGYIHREVFQPATE
jgi:hypothetical protein